MRARPRKTLDANFEISNHVITAVELLIYAASASEHHSFRGVITLSYTDPAGERQRAPAARVLKRATTPCPVLTLGANFEVSNYCTSILLPSSF